MATRFVNTNELKRAFGATHVSKLKRILAMNHIPFFVDAAGQPVTTQSALDKTLGISSEDIEQPATVDLSWMRELEERRKKHEQ